MVDAFATYAELEVLLGRTFTVGEQTQVTALLESASTYLRDDVLGLQVYPQSQGTFEAWPDGGQVVLPQSPVVSLDSVVRDGVTLVEDTDYTRRDNTIKLDSDDRVEVTFTYGYLVAPDDLKRWCLVLASSALTVIERNLGLTAGGLSSVAIDDFKVAFADGGEGTGVSLSDRNIKLIRDSYGVRGTAVVTTR